MRKVFTVILVVFVFLSMATAAFAAADKRATTKLERGGKNLILGWTEIPKSMVNISKKEGIVMGLTVGALKGFGQAFARTLSGAVDVVTFPVGTYDRPAIKPSMIPELEGASEATK